VHWCGGSNDRRAVGVSTQADERCIGSGLDLAYYSLNGTPDHQPVPHRLSMGRSLDDTFTVTSSLSGDLPSSDHRSVSHHRTSSQPSHVIHHPHTAAATATAATAGISSHTLSHTCIQRPPHRCHYSFPVPLRVGG